MITTSLGKRLTYSRCWRALLASAAVLACGTALAQAINDVPMAVKNNVPPNFMFMIDNSGSMSNIVPSAPYNAAVDYSPAGCAGTDVLGTGSTIDLRVSGGEAFIRVDGTNYTHWSIGTGTQRCFGKTSVYLARLLADSGGSPSNYLGAEYDGNFLNWYFSNADRPALTSWTTRKPVASGSVPTRLEVAKIAATGEMDKLAADATTPVVRVGLSTYNNGDGGTLLVGMDNFTPAARTTLKNSINAMTPGGNTPLAETLADIGRYMATGYSGNIKAGTVVDVPINDFLRQDGRQSCLSGTDCETGVTDPVPAAQTGTPARPVQMWCQRSYAFLMTDGRPQGDQAFQNNTHLRDYDGDCSGALAGNCSGGFDRKVAPRTYESAGSDYLDDVAMALFDVDLRPNLLSPDPIKRPKKNNLLTYTIGFADRQAQNDPLLASAARQGGGVFLTAKDANSLVDAFDKVITNALSQDAAAAAVAVANAQITLNNVGFASSYKSGTWFGDLVAYSLDTTTATQVGPDIWSLGAKLDLQTPASRKIASYDGATGRAFSAANFAGTPATLTANVINYLRGDRSLEAVNGGTLRNRTGVLGDIINAEPVVVTYSGVPIIFQGANDGMLHVVDGRTDASAATRGQELWAYVPRLVHDNLAELANPAYAHRYFVDGTPAAAEVTGFAFSRLLVGGLGKGGRGYYALDISSYAAATEADAVSKVLWEFSAANMGYSFGTPLIVKTAAGWRVVVSSGYRNGTNVPPEPSGDGRGRVWVIDPANPGAAIEINTGAGTAANPSGLAHLSRLANAAPDALVRYVYGGDMLGNVWRFDLNANTAVRIAVLTDNGGAVAQPVTAPPEVSLVTGSTTKFVVYVGTGRLLADADVPGGVGENIWATQRQSIYGLFDDTTVAAPALPSLRGANGTNVADCPGGGANGDLVCQELSYVAGTNTYRASTNAVDPATRRGWYLDLPVGVTPPVDSRLINGRMVSKPAITTGGTLTLTVNIPTNVKCEPGGRSWFLALNGATGGGVPIKVGENTYYDAGYFLGFALASRPVIVTTAKGKRALIRMSDKSTEAKKVPETALPTWRRIYWRAVP